MPFYIYGTVVTAAAVSANNRGRSIGNAVPLQKLIFNNQVYSSVSAEAIRFALRYRFQLEGLKVNRTFDAQENKFSFVDETRQCWKNGLRFIDDDLMGFMDARAAQVEESESIDDKPKRNKKSADEIAAKGSVAKRPSPLAVGRAISLRPYSGEMSFNSVAGEKLRDRPTIYLTEMHTTEFQYTFAVNINDVFDKSNIPHLLDAIADPPRVAGNAARFYFDFAPVSVILRLTTDHCARIQNCFEITNQQQGLIGIPGLVGRVKTGDVTPADLILGGQIGVAAESKKLQKLGAEIQPGVKAAMQSLKMKIAALAETGK